jgi:hypothetical protein
MVESKKVSVDIFGSCVSRDFFEAGEHPFIINNFYSFISPISLYLPGTREIPDLEEMTPWLNRNYSFDLRKDLFDHIQDNRSDYLILDLADIRYPITCYSSQKGKFYVTNSRMNRNYSELIRNHFGCDEVITNAFNIDYHTLKNGLSYFSNKVLEVYKRDKIILIEPVLAEEYLEKGVTYRFVGDAGATNAFLRKCYNYVENILRCHIIRIPVSVTANSEHKWGLDRLHYCDATYADILESVRKIILQCKPVEETKRKICTYGPISIRKIEIENNSQISLIKAFYQTSPLSTPGYSIGKVDLERYEESIAESNIVAEDINKAIFSVLLDENPDYLLMDVYDIRIPTISIQINDNRLDLTKSFYWDKINYQPVFGEKYDEKKINQMSLNEVIERMERFCDGIKNVFLGDIVIFKTNTSEEILSEVTKRKSIRINYLMSFAYEIIDRELMPLLSIDVDVVNGDLGGLKKISISDILNEVKRDRQTR